MKKINIENQVHFLQFKQFISIHFRYLKTPLLVRIQRKMKSAKFANIKRRYLLFLTAI